MLLVNLRLVDTFGVNLFRFLVFFRACGAKSELALAVWDLVLGLDLAVCDLVLGRRATLSADLNLRLVLSVRATPLDRLDCLDCLYLFLRLRLTSFEADEPDLNAQQFESLNVR